ncbi:hypothetical protein PR003_g22419 [Phytophthora rubi]|uniref:Uncharacterized protein n=1 Tax=Phytophthora rubi TaxID=129364 RepID=A0A6A4DA62_9STRA|nr:hypothetical protein PR003_g22419 [Phytophthora rubi]
MESSRGDREEEGARARSYEGELPMLEESCVEEEKEEVAAECSVEEKEEATTESYPRRRRVSPPTVTNVLRPESTTKHCVEKQEEAAA